MHKSFVSLGWTLMLCGSIARADLIIGDQRGDARSAMEAAKALEGLNYNVEWKEFPNAAPLIEALNANHLDAGSIGDAPLTFATAAGAKVRATAAFNYYGNAILVGQKSTIQSVKQLVGKRLAVVRGSSGHAMALSALSDNGISYDKIEFVFTTPAESTLALSNGDVDAVATWEPYASFAVLQSGAKLIADGHDYPAISYFAANEKSLADKSAELSDFSQRLTRAREWAVEHAEEYGQVVAKNLRLPLNVANEKVRRERVTPIQDVHAVLARQQRTIDQYAAVGLIKNTFDASSLLSSQLINKK